MGALLSSPKKKKNNKKHREVSETDRAILDLKNARDRLRKYESRLDVENEALTSQAKELIRLGKRDRAKLLLTFRRFRTERVAEVDGQLLKLEEMVQTIEWESEQMKVVDALKSGNNALNAIHSIMTLDSVEELMEETRQAIDKEKQISALLTEAGGSAQLSDNEELLEEYNALLNEADQSSIELPIAPQTSLPSTPHQEKHTDDIPRRESTENKTPRLVPA